ncbi:MAG: hypothetical protein GC159_12400 [Phycisphaera sp.]|nr:hypothetical protein [Phycisphaera sp.]
MSIEQDTIVRVLVRDRAVLLAYIWAIVRDNHLAEDILQDVSVLAVNKRDEITDEEHLHGWLRQTARYKSLTALDKRESSPMRLDDRVLEALEAGWRSESADGGTADLVDALQHCLGKLSGYAKHLVELRYAEGLSGQKLADAVDRNLNTVYVALTRIHRSLGDCVRQQVNEQQA